MPTAILPIEKKIALVHSACERVENGLRRTRPAGRRRTSARPPSARGSRRPCTARCRSPGRPSCRSRPCGQRRGHRGSCRWALRSTSARCAEGAGGIAAGAVAAAGLRERGACVMVCGAAFGLRNRRSGFGVNGRSLGRLGRRDVAVTIRNDVSVMRIVPSRILRVNLARNSEAGGDHPLCPARDASGLRLLCTKLEVACVTLLAFYARLFCRALWRLRAWPPPWRRSGARSTTMRVCVARPMISTASRASM